MSSNVNFSTAVFDKVMQDHQPSVMKHRTLILNSKQMIN